MFKRSQDDSSQNFWRPGPAENDEAKMGREECIVTQSRSQ